MKQVEVYFSPTYKKELKKLKKKNYPIKLITQCLKAIIAQDNKILKKIKHHSLQGNWKRFNEFHPGRLSSNSNLNYDQWIVIYTFSKNKLILTLVSTGNHEILTKHKPKTLLNNKL